MPTIRASWDPANAREAVREAIKVRNTMFFRTRVVAKKEPLKSALGGILAWQEILGTFRPGDRSTLKAAFEAGRLSYLETLEPLISLLKSRKAGLEWKRHLSDTTAWLEALCGPEK